MKFESIFKSARHLLILYFIICTYRVLNALIVQTQFDPDEYWQTLEPAYCISFAHKSTFDYKCAYTWEWTRRSATYAGFKSSNSSVSSFMNRILMGPIRSHVSILPTISLYSFARYFAFDSNFVISKGPALVNALIVAAPTDLATFVIATKVFNMKTKKLYHYANCAFWALFLSLTSWFNGYALSRTYSNSIECMLITIGVALLTQVRLCLL